ncbi:hypothetical protein ACWEQL_40050 [Kitasatospora sp. NPDC004240]
MRRVRHWAQAALALSVLTAATAAAATASAAGGSGPVTPSATAPEPAPTAPAPTAPAATAPTAWTAGSEVPGIGGSRFTANKVPLTTAVMSSGVQLDARTTWAAGFRIDRDSSDLSFRPVVVAQDSRDGVWRELPTPAPGYEGRATAVAGGSPKDAWVFGDLDTRSGRILAEHWDGTAWTHTEVEPPAGELSTAYLLGASAPTPGRAWAVGGASVITARIPGNQPSDPQVIETRTTGLIERWDGSAWHRLDVPAIDGDWWLSSVTEIAPDDVWAVGNTAYPDGQPVLLHYDGRTWTRVPAPAFTGLYGEYQSVSANGPDDVWVVGRAVLADKDRGHPLVAHYDGRTWSTVAVPDGVAGKLWSVAAVPGGMAAVGWDASGEQDRPLGLRYTHGRWETLDLTVIGYPTSSYQAVVAGPAGRLTVIGAGAAAKSPDYRPLILTGRG